ncbi:MAG: hypothetical protein WBM07_05010 [Chitinivibrionales bacterium]
MEKSSSLNKSGKRLPALLMLLYSAFLCAAYCQVGGLAGSYLRFPLGARALAMGGAQTASPDELCAWWDPAMLSTKTATDVSVGGGLMSMGRTGGYSSLEFKITPRVGMGIMPVYLGDPSLNDLYNENEEQLSSGSYTTLTIKAALSYLVTRKLSVGLALDYYYQRLPTSYNDDASLNYSEASAVGGFDFAMRYKIRENWSCAVTMQNIDILKVLSGKSPGVELDWEVGSAGDINASVPDVIAPVIIFGNQLNLKLDGRPFIWACDVSGYAVDGYFNKLDHMEIRLNNGFEWKRWDVFAIRAGFGDVLLNQTVFSNSAGFDPRVTLGFGVNLWKIRQGLMFNYAIATDRLWEGLDQQIDLSYRF